MMTTKYLPKLLFLGLAAVAAGCGEPTSVQVPQASTHYVRIGQTLQSLGVDMGRLPVDLTTDCNALIPAGKSAATDLMPAKYLYCANRIELGFGQTEDNSENLTSMVKLLDLFATAAPEVVANAPVAIFNADHSCNAEGLSVLLGQPATEDQRVLCSRAVLLGVATPASGAVPAISAIDNGKHVAVAAILSATYSVE